MRRTTPGLAGPDFCYWVLMAIQGDVIHLVEIKVSRHGQDKLYLAQTRHFEGTGFSGADINAIDPNRLTADEAGKSMRCPRKVGGLAHSYSKPGAGAAVSPLCALHPAL